MLYNILQGWLAQLLNEGFELVDGIMERLLESMLYVEQIGVVPGSTILSAQSIRDIYTFIYFAACALVALKFFYKGFQIYVMWRDGDADVSPLSMLTGAGAAAFFMAAFPILYDYMADFAGYLARGLMARLGEMTYFTFFTIEQLAMKTLVELVIILIYFVLLLILWLRLLQRGVELLILRLGVPFACVGLIDSDGGLFKGYMQIFIKTLFTSVIQIVLMAWSIRMLATLHFMGIIVGMSMLVTSLHVPALMQHILIQGRVGGGVTSKIYAGSMAAKAVMSLVRK